MTENQKYRRLNILFQVLVFDTTFRPMLTVVDRILINQERGQLLASICSRSVIELRPVPHSVENKIKDSVAQIQRYDWIPMKEDPFSDLQNFTIES